MLVGSKYQIPMAMAEQERAEKYWRSFSVWTIAISILQMQAGGKSSFILRMPYLLFFTRKRNRRHLYTLIQHFGIVDSNARQSFRHTIKGESAKGFKVVNNNGLITIRHDSLCESQWPYWTHDTLINAFVGKLRRLIVVAGRTKTKPRRVCYDTAHLFWEPQTTVLLDAIETGIVAIDFDARTTEGQGLRNPELNSGSNTTTYNTFIISIPSSKSIVLRSPPNSHFGRLTASGPVSETREIRDEFLDLRPRWPLGTE